MTLTIRGFDYLHQIYVKPNLSLRSKPSVNFINQFLTQHFGAKNYKA